MYDVWGNIQPLPKIEFPFQELVVQIDIYVFYGELQLLLNAVFCPRRSSQQSDMGQFAIGGYSYSSSDLISPPLLFFRLDVGELIPVSKMHVSFILAAIDNTNGIYPDPSL